MLVVLTGKGVMRVELSILQIIEVVCKLNIRPLDNLIVYQISHVQNERYIGDAEDR